MTNLDLKEKRSHQLRVCGILAVPWERVDEKFRFDWPSCSSGSKINIISLAIIIIDISMIVSKVVYMLLDNIISVASLAAKPEKPLGNGILSLSLI